MGTGDMSQRFLDSTTTEHAHGVHSHNAGNALINKTQEEATLNSATFCALSQPTVPLVSEWLPHKHHLHDLHHPEKSCHSDQLVWPIPVAGHDASPTLRTEYHCSSGEWYQMLEEHLHRANPLLHPLAPEHPSRTCVSHHTVMSADSWGLLREITQHAEHWPTKMWAFPVRMPSAPTSVLTLSQIFQHWLGVWLLCL